MEEKLLSAIQTLIRRGDDLHGQQIAELEKTIAALHDVLRVLATSSMKLADMKPPSDHADAAIVQGVIEEARKVMVYLEPPSH